MNTNVKFGAALASAAIAGSPASAAIVSLSFSPTSVATGSSNFISVSDTLGAPIGLVFEINNGVKGFGTAAGITGFASFAPGATVSTGAAFGTAFSFSSGASFTANFGFITAANQVGWIQLQFGGLGGPITNVAGAWNDTPGQSIISGGGAVGTVPETSTTIALAGLATLAAGVGLRKARRRKSKDA
ncbi:MAG: hypothetical protein AAFX93_16080 [Verrucomicrobiota bacterium]